MKKLFFAITISSIVASCKTKTEVTASQQFCLTDTLQREATIQEVTPEPVMNAVTLSGKISANEDKLVKVFPTVGGVVSELKVQLGDYVQKGQVLATIHSGEIADYQNQLSVAESNVKVADKSFNDQKEMFSAGLATQRDVLAAQADLDKARSELNRIQHTSSVYGVRSNATQVITAPISGYVVEKNVTDQMQFRIDAAQPFFTIANLDEVWVVANVFESDIAKIKEGYDADIKVLAYPDKTFHGKIDRIFSMLDPQSRVMKVRIKIPNSEKLLKPEMFAQISIKYSDGAQKMPAIPSKAVIFDKNKNFVMVYRDKCDIETREIEIYQTIGDITYIKSGLQPGEKIICKYQLLVYDALND